MDVNAHYLTIGEHLRVNSYIGSMPNDILINIGKDFCATYAVSKDPLTVVKELRFGRLNYEVVDFAIKRNVSSAKLWIQYNSARLNIQYFDKHRLPKDNLPFYVTDMLGFSDRFIVVDGLESFVKGSGAKLLDMTVQRFDPLPVLIQAGYLYYGQYEYIDKDSDCYALVDKLVELYKEHGFVDVNERIGNYEDSTVMLHADAYQISQILSGNHV